MRWTIRFPEPSAPSSSADSDDDLARLIIDEMSGDLGMTYVNDVASWYARENIRSGYQIRVAGHCFKGHSAIMWDQIPLIFEHEHVTTGLSLHLAQIERTTVVWGKSV